MSINIQVKATERFRYLNKWDFKSFNDEHKKTVVSLKTFSKPLERHYSNIQCVASASLFKSQQFTIFKILFIY